jgi:hypothetical protein
MKYEVNLTEEYDALLAFTGSTCEAIVIDRLNTFIGPKRDYDEKQLVEKLKHVSPETLVALNAEADAAIQKEADAKVVAEEEAAQAAKVPLEETK